MKKDWGQAKGDTEQTSKTVLVGGNRFCLFRKENKKDNKRKLTNKQGLGPSEVASRDP